MPKFFLPELLGQGYLKFLLIVILSCYVGGCGSAETSSDAPVSVNSVHEPGWLFAHDTAAQNDLIGCQVCHGVNFQGSGNAVSCFNCHVGGPPFRIHPPSLEPSFSWKHPVNHGSEAKKNIRACQGCHGQRGGSGTNPRFNVAIGNLETGCESALGCHDNFNDPFASFDNGHNPGTAHPSLDPTDPDKQDLVHWYGERIEYLDDSGQIQTYLISHYNAGNLVDACSLCHGRNLQGGSGPACTACHVVSPIAEPANCASCHGAPPIAIESYIQDVGRTEPLNSIYLDAVRGGLHLQHEAIDCAARDEQADCRVCHINTETGLEGSDLRTNVNRHHLLVGTPIPNPTPTGVHGSSGPGGTYGCLTCHSNLDPVTGVFSEPFRDCAG